MKHPLIIALLLTACGRGDGIVRATDYDGTCAVPADCIVIHVGACSDACGYPTQWAAINIKDAARAEEDYQALDCKPGTDTCNPGEPPTGTTCVNNQCGLAY